MRSQRVYSHQDELIWKRTPTEQRRADEDAVYLLNYALHKVTTNGTAKVLANTFTNINMAGKTGTTDDYRDSWFAGFDRNLVSSVWLGHDDTAHQRHRKRSDLGGSGFLLAKVRELTLTS